MNFYEHVERHFYETFRILRRALPVFVGLALGCACGRPDEDWKSAPGGRKLTAASNSGATGSQTEIWFCGSGEYALRRQFTGFSTGGAGTLSTASEDGEQGRWRVESGVLVLEPENGSRQGYELSQGTDENVVRLGGAGYLVTRHDECR